MKAEIKTLRQQISHMAQQLKEGKHAPHERGPHHIDHVTLARTLTVFGLQLCVDPYLGGWSPPYSLHPLAYSGRIKGSASGQPVAFIAFPSHVSCLPVCMATLPSVTISVRWAE